MTRRLLITGSSGLIGSEVVAYFASEGWEVHGVDNNLRADFFGPQGDTRWNLGRLQETWPNFHHHEVDIRDRAAVLALLREVRPTATVHAAAQPSHDLAASRPSDDFDVNAVGTLNMLEAARLACPESPVVHMSTNKVYGDAPNEIALAELPTRWDYADPGPPGVRGWMRRVMTADWPCDLQPDRRIRGHPGCHSEYCFYQFMQTLRFVRLGKPPAANGEDGLATLRLIEIGYNVARPLRIPWLTSAAQEREVIAHWGPALA